MYYTSLCEEKPVYKPALEKFYGPLDEEKIDEVKKLVQCRKFQNGFQRHICPDCGLILIVPFSQRVF